MSNKITNSLFRVGNQSLTKKRFRSNYETLRLFGGINPLFSKLRFRTGVAPGGEEPVLIDADTLAQLTKMVTDAQTANVETEKATAEADEEAQKLEQEKEDKRMENLLVGVLQNLNPGGKGPAFNRIKSLGYEPDDGPMDAYNQWLITGQVSDDMAELEKAAYNITTDAEGGYAVPEGGYTRFAEKRDEVSIPRIMGANVEPAEATTFKIPVEDTKFTDWVIVAEAGPADQDEGTMAQFVATLYLFSKMQKFSIQVLQDSRPDLVSHVARRNGRSLGVTENRYFLTGTGSGQPQGVTVGGTAAQQIASSSTITPAEVLTNIYALTEPYADNAVWTMKGSTEKVIRGLQGDPFLFAPTPQAEQAGPRLRDIGGHKVFRSEKMPAFGSDNNIMALGDWRDYTILEGEQLIMDRNTKLFQGTYQVAYFSYVRLGGALEIAEAFQITQAAT